MSLGRPQDISRPVCGDKSRCFQWEFTSVPLSSSLGVSGGEGIATGKDAQMQTLPTHTWTHTIPLYLLISSKVNTRFFGAFSGLNSCVLVSRDHFQGHFTVHTVWHCTAPRSGQTFHLQARTIRADQSWSLETRRSWFFHTRLHTESAPPRRHRLGPLTLWTVRVQSWGGTKRVAPAASWEEPAVIHAECVSGDWVTLPREEKAGSTHCTHCWNRRHLTYTRQVRSVCGGACVCMRIWNSICRFACMCVSPSVSVQ